MSTQHTLSIPEAFERACQTGDIQLMQVVAESLLDLLFQVDQLDDNDDKASAIQKLTEHFDRPQQRLN